MRSVSSEGEACSREGKRFLSRKHGFSRENASPQEKTFPLSRKRFPSEENAFPLEVAGPIAFWLQGSCLEMGSIFSRGEVFPRGGKRFLERGSGSSRGEAFFEMGSVSSQENDSPLEKTRPSTSPLQKRFPSRGGRFPFHEKTISHSRLVFSREEACPREGKRFL